MRVVDPHALFHSAKLSLVAVVLLCGAASGVDPAKDCPAPVLEPAQADARRAPRLGTQVSTLPPDCRTSVYRSVAYARCGAVWYRPRYQGFSVSYIVVKPPC